MYILVASFYISLLGIISMIVLKRFELRSANTNSSANVSSLEIRLQNIYNSINRSLKMLNRKTFIALAQYITFHILYRIRKVYVELKHRALMNPHGKRMIDAIRGRGEINKHGASFYLRRISDR